MYTILYELNYHDGTLEGICQKDDKVYYYVCGSDVMADGPRLYYIYLLDGPVGGSLKVAGLILETDLKK